MATSLLSVPAPAPMPAVIYQEGLCCSTRLPGFIADEPDHRRPAAVAQFDAGVAAAKALCQRCPVLDVCRNWALAHEDHCVYGGMTGAERIKLRGSRLRATITERMEAVEIRDAIAAGIPDDQISTRFGVARRTLQRHRARTRGAA